MDMRIGGTGPVSAVHAHAASNWKKGLQGFSALKSALQSGDLEAAKAAFAGLHVPQSTHAKSPLAKVGQALQSGDVAAAQTMMQAPVSYTHLDVYKRQRLKGVDGHAVFPGKAFMTVAPSLYRRVHTIESLPCPPMKTA